MADADNILLSYVAETTYRNPPGSPTLVDVRLTREGLTFNPSYSKSTEITGNRQVADQVLLDVAAGGQVGGLFSYGTYDDWLASAFFSTWSSPVSVGAGFQVTPGVSGSNLTLTRSSGSWTTAGFTQYSAVEVTGFTSTLAPNNGYWKVVTPGTTVMTLSPFVGTATAGAQQATGAITVTQGGALVNGQTMTSFYLEKNFKDLTNAFEGFYGQVPGSCTIVVNSKGFLECNFDFTGAYSVGSTTSLQTGGSHTAAPVNRVFNSVHNVLGILEGGATFNMTKFEIGINNNLRTRSEIATLGAKSLGVGDFDVSGTIEAYFSDQTLMNKFRNDQETSAAIVFAEAIGTNAYVLDLPRGKYTAGASSATGKNTDILSAMKFGCMESSAEGITARLTRFP